VRRARFGVEELVQLTLDFYKRNYIEGLFLSSGIMRSPNYTMERMVEVARQLRETHAFQGYIHLKTIPDAAPELLDAAARYADRVSINVELPSRTSLRELAPEKNATRIRQAMAVVRLKLDEKAEDTRRTGGTRGKVRRARDSKLTSQSTQMIVGADASDDRKILDTSASLYASYKLGRVYYSAFSPTPFPSSALPEKPPPLRREHRLYQADWLLRYYGFELNEILAGGENGMLDLDIDPKLAWALKHRERFPLDVNRAPRDELLRVPGLGTRSVNALVKARHLGALRLADIARLTTSIAKVRPFILTRDWTPGRLTESPDLRARLVRPPKQQELFA
jgi:putative DNA modification/repair radical SAM protein